MSDHNVVVMTDNANGNANNNVTATSNASKVNINNNTIKAAKSNRGESTESDEENFEDAIEFLDRDQVDVANPIAAPSKTDEEVVKAADGSATPELLKSITETRHAMRLFLDNRFEHSRTLCASAATDSIYHGLGLATVLTIKSALTCEPVDIEQAVSVVKRSIEVCDRYRRQSSLSGSVGRMVSWTKPTSLSDSEMHAELCLAECLLQRAFLTFLQDESLTSFVKGAYKIRLCYLSYRECERYMQSSDYDQRDVRLREHFASGTKMGIGTFNLMIASLPTRVLKLLEFVGFPADKSAGLRYLEEGAAMSDTLRAPLCAIVLLSWHLVAVFVIDTGDTDLGLCHKLLTQLSTAHPNGALVLFFRARYHMVLAEFDVAVACLYRSMLMDNQLPQLHHVCLWELMFCNMFTRNWAKAFECADRLFQENKWSKCIYAYISAILLLTMDEEKDPSAVGRAKLMNDRFSSVNSLKQRIAGKSLPLEKFCAVKAGRFLRTQKLVLAPFELLYFWSGFHMLAKDASLVEPVLVQIEYRLTQGKIDEDDVCLCLLLKALCLRYMQSPFQAEQCLYTIVQKNVQLTDNTYVVPNAYFELALLAFEANNMSTAKKYLAKAKDFKGYLLESRLHFRIHALTNRINAM